MITEELVPDPVELVRGDPRRDVPADLGQGLRGDAASDPHPLDRLGILDVGFADPRVFLADIFGGRDRRRNLPHRRHPAGLEHGRHDLGV